MVATGEAFMKILLVLCTLATGALAGDKGKVLVVVSSESKITLKDGKTHETGFYMNELLVPLKQVLDAGYTPVFANPKGTAAVMDANSDSAAHFANDEKLYQEMRALLASLDGLRTPKPLAAINAEGVSNYAGVLVPGGHAPMEDLATDPEMGKLLSSFHQAGKPTGLICHGPIALLSALKNADQFARLVPEPKKTSPQKDWAYYGYRVTVFSTPEEKDAEKGILKGKVKFYPEAALRLAGAKVKNGPKWKANVVRDRELITGQNPASDKEFGKKFVEALNEKQPKS